VWARHIKTLGVWTRLQPLPISSPQQLGQAALQGYKRLVAYATHCDRVIFFLFGSVARINALFFLQNSILGPGEDLMVGGL
jgi:hypothetical protein